MPLLLAMTTWPGPAAGVSPSSATWLRATPPRRAKPFSSATLSSHERRLPALGVSSHAQWHAANTPAPSRAVPGRELEASVNCAWSVCPDLASYSDASLNPACLPKFEHVVALGNVRGDHVRYRVPAVTTASFCCPGPGVALHTTLVPRPATGKAGLNSVSDTP